MMIKIAVIADSHLPDYSGTVKDDVFEWALATAIEKQADVIVAAGDLTAIGTIEAAKRVKQKLNATTLPYLLTPGNAEIRSPEFSKEVLSELQTPVKFEQNACYALVLDSSKQKLTDKDRNIIKDLARQGYRQIFVATHFPLTDFPKKDQKFLRELIESGTIGIFVAGHLHVDASEHIGKGEYHLVRGIDPDKAIGGPPALAVFDYDSENQHWQRSNYNYSIAWTDESLIKFKQLLGISCMQNSLEGIEKAISHNIKSIELRYECTKNISYEKLFSLIKQWRKQGGQHLSMHLPDIVWNQENFEVEGVDEVKFACELASELGSNVLTMHTPRCPVGLINNADIKNQLLDAYVDALKTVLAKGITLGIENLHMNPGEKPDSNRGFGYTPNECLGWINALRKSTGSANIGFHFDIGHALNNAPYSSLYTISQWFAELGSFITGYHLHQVKPNEEGRLINHRPVGDVFGSQISFCSLFAAWNKGQINHAPMYLEIRYNDTLESLKLFSQIFIYGKIEKS